MNDEKETELVNLSTLAVEMKLNEEIRLLVPVSIFNRLRRDSVALPGKEQSQVVELSVKLIAVQSVE